MPEKNSEEKIEKKVEMISVPKEEYETMKTQLAEAKEQLEILAGYYQRAVTLCNTISDKFIRG